MRALGAAMGAAYASMEARRLGEYAPFSRQQMSTGEQLREDLSVLHAARVVETKHNGASTRSPNLRAGEVDTQVEVVDREEQSVRRESECSSSDPLVTRKPPESRATGLHSTQEQRLSTHATASSIPATFTSDDDASTFSTASTLSTVSSVHSALSTGSFGSIKSAGFPTQLGTQSQVRHGFAHLHPIQRHIASTVCCQSRTQPPLHEQLPITLFNLVMHKGKARILADAANDKRFSHDPYVVANKPRSVLCMPSFSAAVLCRSF